MMGHKGEYLDDAYFKPYIEQMLKEYRKALPQLTIREEGGVTREEVALETLRSVARTFGIDPLRLRIEMFAGEPAPEEEIAALERLIREARGRERSAAKEQAVVGEEEAVRNHLRHGWRVACVLPSGKLVLER